MLPVIAIAGRPNVGKSTLFNCLTRSREALVVDEPGVTRDRQYGNGEFQGQPFIVIDTGGLGDDEINVATAIVEQAWEAITEADIVLFMVDARAGLTGQDEEIAAKLRRSQKKVLLVVNKIDGLNPDIVLADFYGLGFEIFAIAAVHRRGITQLLEKGLPELSDVTQEEEQPQNTGIKIAIVGKPNVGKSTLVNRILGEERVVVYDEPGTTRDSISIPFQRRGKDYTLIDTAGIRRRGRITATVEKFSVIKALQAVVEANVVILVIDARINISEQDLRLLSFILDAGKALVIALNKWDGLDQFVRDQTKKELDRRLRFIDFAEIFYISALHGTKVGNLFPAIHRAYRSAQRKLATPALTKILKKLVTAHEPPLIRGRRVKLLYAHAGGQNPPTIIIHGRQIKSISSSYRKYLEKSYRKILKLIGTPLRIEFKEGENPYKDKRNLLNKRQLAKRKRIIKRR